MVESTADINYIHLSVMIIIFIITYYLIINKTFDKTMAGMLGALATLITISIVGESYDPPLNQERFFIEDLSHDYLILAILLGNLLMVTVASEIGIFQFISIKLLKITNGDPNKLYWTLGTMTFIFSAFIGTIPTILIVGALTIVACKELEFDPQPYVLMEIVITNTGGLTTLISAITNLIIAIPFRIAYLQFMIISVPLAIILFFVSMYTMIRIVPLTPINDQDGWRVEKIKQFNEWNFVQDRKRFYLTSAIFALSLLLLLISEQIRMEISVIFIGGGILMLFSSGKEVESVLAKIDWTLLAFFTSLFILIKGLELMGLLLLITKFLIAIMGDDPLFAAVILLLFVSLFSGLLDNVVLAVALTPVLVEVAVENPDLNIGLLVWALIIGTNLGGGLTPIGAPPSVLGLGILYRETGIKIGWGTFFKSVGVVTVIRIIISIVYIFILSFFDSSDLIG